MLERRFPMTLYTQKALESRVGEDIIKGGREEAERRMLEELKESY